jgi:WS/DGAT/MGAT family acyltransferase
MSVDRLSPLDASFLAVESPTAHMHVGWASVFEPPLDRPRPSFEELRAHVERRLCRAPRYRQVLHELPLAIGTPAWVDDRGFDIERHVLPARSDDLGEIVETSMSTPLERDRPLWQLAICERLRDGRIGVVGKAHHCMVDGIAAVELASLLLDPAPEAPDPAPEDWSPAPEPTDSRLLAEAIRDSARVPLGILSAPAHLAASPHRLLETARRGRRAVAALVDAARPTSPHERLNRPISPRRRLGLLSRPLDDLVRIKSAFDVKLNDVVLAACAGGVRHFLRQRAEDPTRLKAMVPVSVRREEPGRLGNAISFMFVDLPCDEPDPARRLRQVHAGTVARKRGGIPAGGSEVIRAIGLVPAPIRSVISRLMASPQAFNLAVSNIPGPREPLWMRGCRLEEAYPVVPIPEQHALSVGVATVGEDACFGVYADRESLPDVEGLTASIDAAIDELLALAGDDEANPDALTVASG